MEAGKYIEVHPTFLYESICTLVIFIVLILKSRNRRFKGEITLIYLIVYSFIRMQIEELRTDSLMLGSIKISQALSFAIFIISLSFFIKFSKTKRQNNIKTIRML